IMAPKESKGMEIEVVAKGLKRLQKGTKGASSSVAKAGNARQFGAQKEDKYAPKNKIDEGHLTLEFLVIRDKLCELGVGYICVEQEECNLTLVR
ncbi:hypothetical protein HAX54_039917, partial [Datura stramonium]|nr:hypothetical protein [Datura stramonium]